MISRTIETTEQIMKMTGMSRIEALGILLLNSLEELKTILKDMK